MSLDAVFTRNRKVLEPGHGSLCKLCRNLRRGRKCAVADQSPELVQTGIPKLASAMFCNRARMVHNDRNFYGPRDTPLP